MSHQYVLDDRHASVHPGSGSTPAATSPPAAYASRKTGNATPAAAVTALLPALPRRTTTTDAPPKAGLRVGVPVGVPVGVGVPVPAGVAGVVTRPPSLSKW